MKMKILKSALGIWLAFAILAILNGIFRNLVLESTAGKYAVHLVSTLILICIVLLIAFLFMLRALAEMRVYP